MKRLLIASLIILSACERSPTATKTDIEELSRRNIELTEKLEAARAEITKAEKKSADDQLASASKALATIDEVDLPEPHRLCWQDYCPCEAPETALDRIICRNAKGGIAMSDDQWSIGAQARDSKREGDRLNAEMDDIITDMRVQ